MAKIILAVSGGVDSVTMLDMVCRHLDYAPGDIIIAHFDHGIRSDSNQDAQFVIDLAKQYGLACKVQHAKLSIHTSEAEARKQRYQFLSDIAMQNGDAEIWTAQHLDDLVETIMINLVRGTGWRGLSAFDRIGIRRPFLDTTLCLRLAGNKTPLSKTVILEYAGKHGLCFREDSTNNSDCFLRNRVRTALYEMHMDEKLRLFKLWCRQKNIKYEIDSLVSEIVDKNGGRWDRKKFVDLAHDSSYRNTALEILREVTLRSQIPTTRPQLQDFLDAILNYDAGKRFNLPGDRMVKFTKDEFWIESEAAATSKEF